MDNVMPDSYTKREKELEMIAEFSRYRLGIGIKSFLNPITCDDRFLDAIASFYGIDFFGNALDMQGKQESIRDGILIKKRRGTLWAVKKVVNSLSNPLIIEEGTLGFPLNGTILLDGMGILGGNSGAFVLNLTSKTPINNVDGKKTIALVGSVAPARTQLIIHHPGMPLDGSSNLNGKYTLGVIDAFS